MSATSPEQATLLLAEAFRTGDLEAAVDLYEPDATFFEDPGKPVTGSDAIREVFSGIIARKPALIVENIVSAVAGDIALTQNKWNFTATGPDGAATESSGLSAEVLRRQPDGSWRFIIDNPWGAG